jgi:cell division protein FtsI/penicillin-binding protein 2
VLAGEQRPSALVVVRPSTGEVLAVANGPDGGSANLALEGQYPPGSAFKVVSTLAYLQGGTQPDQTVECPATATVDGRSFKNAEDEVLGPIPFRQAFAHSCNTAFVNLSDLLEPTTLTETAKQFGLGREWDLGVDAFAGSVPENDSAVDLAASAFGQGRLLTSPFNLAMVAATVADGNWRSPVLVRDPLPEGTAAVEPLPDGTADTLRTLMREVVTDGTGDAVAAVPGGPVHGKTGTAEFGTDVPPKSHAWFIGFQGDLAFACFVDSGEFGGDTAAPIVADLLTRLAG